MHRYVVGLIGLVAGWQSLHADSWSTSTITGPSPIVPALAIDPASNTTAVWGDEDLSLILDAVASCGTTGFGPTGVVAGAAAMQVVDVDVDAGGDLVAIWDSLDLNGHTGWHRNAAAADWC
jgi:hypothetical protein